MNTSFERNIIYSLPLISIIFEILKSFIPSDGMLGARNYAFLLIILFLLIKYFNYVIKFNVYLVLLMLYFFVLLVVNRVELSTFNRFIIAFDAKMLLPLGFVLTSSYEHIQRLHKKLLITNILFVVSIIAFSLLGIGTNVYGGDSGFKVGYFIYGHIYTGSFLLIILPVIFSDEKNKLYQLGLILLGTLTLVILVLSVRRTSIVIVLIGVMVYVYLYRNHISRIVQYAVATVLILFLMFPLFQDTLAKQMEARARVFESGPVVKIEEETRMAETIAVWEERLLTRNFKKMMFGQYLFNSVGNYAGGAHEERPIHLDINLVLHGAGVVGLILFILFYIKIYYKYLVLKLKLNLPNEKLLIGAFIGIYLSQLFVLISGGMLTLTFNMISYLYMGAILGLFRHQWLLRRAKGYLNIDTNDKAPESKIIPRKKSKPFIYEATNDVVR